MSIVKEVNNVKANKHIKFVRYRSLGRRKLRGAPYVKRYASRGMLMGILRLILAITVVIAHSNSLFGFRFTGGLVAVETFFIISGFYMSMILDKKYTGKGSYSLFLSNRFLRLYPMFWVVLLLTIFISIMSYVIHSDWLRLSAYIQHYDLITLDTLIFQIITNIVIFGQDLVMFIGVDPESGSMYFSQDFRTTYPRFHHFLLVPQAWSLGVEVLFYLIAPYIVRRSNLFVITLLSVSLLIKIYTYIVLELNHDPWSYRFFLSELHLFLLGTVSYRLYCVYKIHQSIFLGRKLTNIVVIVLFLIVIFFPYIPQIGSKSVTNYIFYFYCCLSIPFLFDLSKSSKIDSRIGELSYPVYITHILIISCVTLYSSMLGWEEYKGELSILLTVIVSYLLVRMISDPIEKIRQARV